VRAVGLDIASHVRAGQTVVDMSTVPVALARVDLPGSQIILIQANGNLAERLGT